MCIFAYAFWVYLPRSAEMHKTGLPQEPDYFVNREQELETILQSVTGSVSQRSRIITITGSPGYGKTTLAKVCAHRFVSQGITVRYVDLQHVCDIQGIVSEILYVVGSTDRYPSKMQLSRWARWRASSELVLVLDNADCFTLSGEGLKKEFSNLIKDFIIEPSQTIHVIITTQYQLGYIHSFQLIVLDRFSESHAKDLLLYRNPTLPANVTTTLANYTDGNPLALQILSALLHKPNAPGIVVLLEQLRFDPVKTLSRDDVHEKLNHVFEIAVEYLSEKDYQCFLVVNQFPSSFDEASASAVLIHFLNESEPACLGHLLAHSLLEYNRNSQRYAVIPLLKTFAAGVNIAQQYSMIQRQFFPVYAKQLLRMAIERQLLSDLLNFLKANYVGIQYLINGYVSLSKNASDFNTSLDLLLPFSLSTFDMLPLLQPVNSVEMFWFSVQNFTWNIINEGFEGHCDEFFEQAIEFETLLADYLLSAGRNNTVEAGRLSSRARMISEQFIKHQALIASDCIETVTLLTYLGHVAKYSRDETVYEYLLKAIMHLASSKNQSFVDADYNIGIIYFEMNEYHLAVEFLNRSLTSSQGNQRLNAAKTIVLALQGSGQQELAANTATRLVHYLLEQASSEFHTARLSQFQHGVRSLNYETVLQNATEMLNRYADSFFTAIDIAITVNKTELSLSLLHHVWGIFFNVKNPLPPSIRIFFEHCLEEPRYSFLLQQIWVDQCLEIERSMTRESLVFMQFTMYETRVRCDVLLACTRPSILQHAKDYTAAQRMSRLMTKMFNNLVDMEGFWSNLCVIMETDSVECQMARSKVQLVWQLQYELAEGLARLFTSLNMLEKAKEYTEIALEKLHKSSVKKKWKVCVDHKFNLAMIELSLGSYWNAVNILRNCSLIIDKDMIENVYKATQPHTTWQGHDLSLPGGHLSYNIWQNYIFSIFNISKVMASVACATSPILHRGIVTHLLFIAIVAVLCLLVFTILFIFGSIIHLVKFICSCCTSRQSCLDRIRLFFYDLTTVMCAFSHIVVFFAYILHFYTITLLTYLNYI